MNTYLKKHQEKINQVIKKQGISYLAVYGSYARNEQSKSSDIDMIVKFSGPKDLVDLIETQHDLEDILNKKVDLVTFKGLSPHLKPLIERDLQILYEGS